MKEIWCLFSIDCAYNQPNNNLVVWWETKPDFSTLKSVFSGIYFDKEIYNNKINDILKGEEIGFRYIFNGKESEVCYAYYRFYRLENVKCGEVLNSMRLK